MTPVRDVWLAGAGFVFGWLMSKSYDDPGCRLGLVLFMVVTAVLVLAFVLAVVGHDRKVVEAVPDEDDEDDEDGEKPSR